MKRFRNIKGKRSLFSRIFLYIAVSISLTIVIITVSLRFFYENAFVDIINNSMQNNLRQISYSARYMKDTALTNAKQIFFINDFNRILNFTSLSYVEINRGRTRLTQFLATTPYIQSIYLYNGKNGTFFTNEKQNPITEKYTFHDSFVVDYVENQPEDRSFVPYTRHLSIDTTSSDISIDTTVYTFFYFPAYGFRTELDSAVIINISESWITDIIQDIRLDSDSEIFIIDEQGMIVSSTDKQKMFMNISQEEYIREISGSEDQSGSYMADIDETRFLVSYTSLDDMKWRFVQLTPYSKVLSIYSAYRNLALMIAAVVLLLGIIVSRIISGRIYIPIKTINKKLEDIEKSKRKLFFTHKQAYLNSVIQGTVNYSAKSLEENFRYFNMSIDLTDNYRLIVFKIEKYKELCTGSDSADKDIIIFGILNITSEIIARNWKNECVCSEGRYIVAVCGIGDDIDLKGAGPGKNIEEIRDIVNSAFGISLTAVVSGPVQDLESISKCYEESLELMHYFVFRDSSETIFPDTIHFRDVSDYKYPAEEEQRLAEYLRSGNYEKACDSYKRIIDGTKDFPFSVFHTSALQIALSLHSLSVSLNRNGGYDNQFDFTVFINELNGFEKICEIDLYFMDAFRRITDRLANSGEERYKKLFDTISSMIEENSYDPNFSIEMIAEEVGLSTVYLGQIYKKQTSRSISEVITKRRLGKACDLLKETNLPISVIVEQCGFISNAYFYPLFKKYHGVTPNEFRRNIGK